MPFVLVPSRGLLEPSDETEPVTATGDHAEIRWLGTTGQVSVAAPASLQGRGSWPHAAIEDYADTGAASPPMARDRDQGFCTPSASKAHPRRALGVRLTSCKSYCLSRCSRAAPRGRRPVMLMVVICHSDLRMGPSEGGGERQEAWRLLRRGGVGVPGPVSTHVLGPGSLGGGRARDHDRPFSTAADSVRCACPARRPYSDHQRAASDKQGAKTV